jgi:hypothetical protein
MLEVGAYESVSDALAMQPQSFEPQLILPPGNWLLRDLSFHLRDDGF